MQRWEEATTTTASCCHWECSTLQPSWLLLPSSESGRFDQPSTTVSLHHANDPVSVLPSDIPSAGASQPPTFLSIQTISNVEPAWMACISSPHRNSQSSAKWMDGWMDGRMVCVCVCVHARACVIPSPLDQQWTGLSQHHCVYAYICNNEYMYLHEHTCVHTCPVSMQSSFLLVLSEEREDISADDEAPLTI